MRQFSLLICCAFALLLSAAAKCQEENYSALCLHHSAPWTFSRSDGYQFNSNENYILLRHVDFTEKVWQVIRILGVRGADTIFNSRFDCDNDGGTKKVFLLIPPQCEVSILSDTCYPPGHAGFVILYGRSFTVEDKKMALNN
jgi:hypothetical protein